MTKTVKRVPSIRTGIVALLATVTLSLDMSATAQSEPDKTYDIVYTARFDAGRDVAQASISIGPGSKNIRQLRFHIDPQRHSGFRGVGEVVSTDENVIWTPPRTGGVLTYEAQVTETRTNGAFDAYITKDWALFRGSDIFPPATTRTLIGAKSKSSLVLELPEGWSSVTQYRSGDDKNTYAFDNPARRFDRPTGWILIGEIGVRRAKIAATRVAIASPVGERFRRMDVMALLNWTLPGIRDVFPTLDSRLVIVGAGDPMWRGGLSGPGSLYLHADRPLISENGTSTLLHELVHVAMGVAGAGHDDWLVEGLAEYYSIKILQTSGTLSARRMELTLKGLEKWGKDVDDLFVRTASGAVTARATVILAKLDALLVEQSSDGRGLNDVVAAMLDDNRPFSYRALCIAARGVLGAPVAMLSPERIPGAPADSECRSDDS